MYSETFPHQRYSMFLSSPGRFKAAHALEMGLTVLLNDAKCAIVDNINVEANNLIRHSGHSAETRARLDSLQEWEGLKVDQGQFSVNRS